MSLLYWGEVPLWREPGKGSGKGSGIGSPLGHHQPSASITAGSMAPDFLVMTDQCGLMIGGPGTEKGVPVPFLGWAN